MAFLTFLGTSDAQGVPRLICTCSICSGREPLNIRKRPSVSIQTQEHHLLIDISPDFRQQFLQYNNRRVPSLVLITHAHNDHIGGMGDYGDLCFWNKISATIVSPPEIIDFLQQRYAYLAKGRGITFVPSTAWQTEDWQITFHQVNHGFNGYSYGIRFAGKKETWGYVPDAFNVTNEQFAPFRHVNLLVLGTSCWLENADPNHRSVYDVQEALRLKSELNVTNLVLTHLFHDIDLPHRQTELPQNVQFAFDGMKLQLPL